jgi:hypothetical protein
MTAPRAKKPKPVRKTRTRKDTAEPVETVRDECAGPFVGDDVITDDIDAEEPDEST